MDFSQLVNVRHLEEGHVAVIAVGLTLNFLNLGHNMGTLLLEKLAIGIVINIRNIVLVHDVIVKELC
jgi:Na+-transporting methylmalonyl-CoA/oxaloacetate decarboxylase beta subunit